jgi:Fic family protein
MYTMTHKTAANTMRKDANSARLLPTEYPLSQALVRSIHAMRGLRK